MCIASRHMLFVRVLHFALMPSMAVGIELLRRSSFGDGDRDLGNPLHGNDDTGHALAEAVLSDQLMSS